MYTAVKKWQKKSGKFAEESWINGQKTSKSHEKMNTIFCGYPELRELLLIIVLFYLDSWRTVVFCAHRVNTSEVYWMGALQRRMHQRWIYLKRLKHQRPWSWFSLISIQVGECFNIKNSKSWDIGGILFEFLPHRNLGRNVRPCFEENSHYFHKFAHGKVIPARSKKDWQMQNWIWICNSSLLTHTTLVPIPSNL